MLRQTVPDGAKTEEVVEMELYLRDLVRRVDSSLLEEWERMRDPDFQPARAEEAEPAAPGRDEPVDVTRDARAFTAAIRARVFALLRGWSTGDDEAALEVLDSALDGAGEAWTADRLGRARETFAAEHGGLRLDPEGRNRRHTHTEPSDDGAAWRVEQMLVDTEGHNDWVAALEVDLAASRAAGEPVMRLLRLESLTP